MSRLQYTVIILVDLLRNGGGGGKGAYPSKDLEFWAYLSN